MPLYFPITPLSSIAHLLPCCQISLPDMTLVNVPDPASSDVQLYLEMLKDPKLCFQQLACLAVKSESFAPCTVPHLLLCWCCFAILENINKSLCLSSHLFLFIGRKVQEERKWKKKKMTLLILLWGILFSSISKNPSLPMLAWNLEYLIVNFYGVPQARDWLVAMWYWFVFTIATAN